MAKYGTSLRNIYIMNDYGVVCGFRLDCTEPWPWPVRRNPPWPWFGRYDRIS